MYKLSSNKNPQFTYLRNTQTRYCYWTKKHIQTNNNGNNLLKVEHTESGAAVHSNESDSSIVTNQILSSDCSVKMEQNQPIKMFPKTITLKVCYSCYCAYVSSEPNYQDVKWMLS